jgi:hypothetical protein
MLTNRRRFERPLGEQSYRKLYLLAVEGTKTEPQYFALFDDEHAIVRVSCLKGDSKSAPLYVLKRMQEHIEKNSFRDTDEAWLVVDKDAWKDAHLTKLHAWAESADNYGLALSNPKFEYWLLLHFEVCNGIVSSRDCTQRLKSHVPGYDKAISRKHFTPESIKAAVARAKAQDTPPCSDWPRKLGGTTVYRLIESILRAQAGEAPSS